MNISVEPGYTPNSGVFLTIQEPVEVLGRLFVLDKWWLALFESKANAYSIG